MAQTVKPEALAAAISPHVEAGEAVRYSVYGRDLSPWKVVVFGIAIFVPASFLARQIAGGAPPLALALAIPTVAAVPFAFILVKTIRDFIVALTSQRLILIEVKTPVFSIDLTKQKSVMAWPLNNLPAVSGNHGRTHAKISIRDPRVTATLRIGYIGQRGSKAQTASLLDALSARSNSAPEPGE